LKPIYIYNTLSRTQELFTPIVPGHIGFYTCGVTVYDYSHIGHARVYVTTDVMRRVLKAAGYTVTYVQNFTDIDDKIIHRSAAAGIDYHQFTEKYITAYKEDMAALGIIPADVYPRATDYLSSMIGMIEAMISSGNAYVSDSGDVWFSVATTPGYGKLSRKKIDELIAGARVDAVVGKRCPSDFVLWKSAKPGEPNWPSPWGNGRPGWHIECSAMARDLLGDTIDIHAGGEDLIFPHHENEICQSETVTQKPFVNYWIHNGFVTIKDEKMSKSLGNFFTIRDVLSTVPAAALRFFLLRSHYRSPLQYSIEGIHEANTALEKLLNTITTHHHSPSPSDDVGRLIADCTDAYWTSITSDFNFAEGIGVCFDLSRIINTYSVSSAPLAEMLSILGFDVPDAQESLPTDILDLLDARWQAKLSRNFSEADRLRNLLIEKNIIIEDTKDGYRWKRKGT